MADQRLRCTPVGLAGAVGGAGDAMRRLGVAVAQAALLLLLLLPLPLPLAQHIQGQRLRREGNRVNVRALYWVGVIGVIGPWHRAALAL